MVLKMKRVYTLEQEMSRKLLISREMVGAIFLVMRMASADTYTTAKKKKIQFVNVSHSKF